MTQDEKWLAKYIEVVLFIESNKRNPSKYRIEEHDMLNWLKTNRKALNAGRMKGYRWKRKCHVYMDGGATGITTG